MAKRKPRKVPLFRGVIDWMLRLQRAKTETERQRILAEYRARGRAFGAGGPPEIICLPDDREDW